MTYYVRYMGYNRWPEPVFHPLGPDTLQQEPPQYKHGRIYRLNLLNLTREVDTWPEFIVVRSTSQPLDEDTGQLAILIEVFVVLLEEWPEFVEPFRSSTLN